MIGKRHEYDAMAECERQLWWYRDLHELTLQTIKKSSLTGHPRILDAGCGTGGLLAFLKEKGFSDIAGFDLSTDAVSYAQQAVEADIRLLDITQTGSAYPQSYFDIIISHDILCLLPEGLDSVALVQLLGVLKPGGLLLMNLPALESFRGTHDIAVNMQRRYSMKAIRQLVAAKAIIKDIIYWPFILSPVIFLVRSIQKIKLLFINKKNIVSDVKMPSRFLNTFFHSVTSFENRTIHKKPWGSSLFVVLVKPVG